MEQLEPPCGPYICVVCGRLPHCNYTGPNLIDDQWIIVCEFGGRMVLRSGFIWEAIDGRYARDST